MPTHGDGANRNDNKYIDNGPTYHQVVGNLDRRGIRRQLSRRDAARHRSADRRMADSGKVLRARYGIPLDRVYAHNWIDFKDARYCEGCALATLAREWGE